MAEIILFHHAQGLTEGVRAFAEALRSAGHVVTVPDMYEGHTFETLEDGLEYADEVGFGEVMRRGQDAIEEMPGEVVYAGFSLGVLPAQALAQTKPGARGALFFHSCVPPTEFADEWPAGVPVQVHAMQDDELFVEEGDLDAARELEKVAGAELFLYEGDAHLFADSSLEEYDEEAAALLLKRVLAFLAAVDAA
jgi:dienelactone hydrolase